MKPARAYKARQCRRSFAGFCIRALRRRLARPERQRNVERTKVAERVVGAGRDAVALQDDMGEGFKSRKRCQQLGQALTVLRRALRV